MLFKIIFENKLSFIQSKHNTSKYQINNPSGSQYWYLILSEIGKSYSFYDLEPQKQKEARILFKRITNHQHPFADRFGPTFDKYDAVIQVETEYFLWWLYLKSVKDTAKNKSIVSLDVMKRNDKIRWRGNIFRIVKIEEQIYEINAQSCLELKKFKIKKHTDIPVITICYDCETLVYKDKITPFMIVAKQEMNDDRFIWKYDKIDVDDTILEGPLKFVQWLKNFINGIMCMTSADFYFTECVVKVRLYGFNNFNFDDHFIYDALRTVFTDYKLDYYSRYGKTTSCTLSKFGLKLYLNDLIKWFPASSLAKACKNYKITQAKYDIDIYKYTQEISALKKIIHITNDLHSYFKTPPDDEFTEKYKSAFGYNIYQLIEDYCIRDVDATAELYKKLSTNLKTVFDKLDNLGYSVPSYDIFDYVSTPQLAFNICSSMMAKAGQQILLFKNPLHSAKIYEAYMGGRCDFTFIGELNASPSEDESSEFKYMDVTSEYPHAMKADFPDVSDINTIIVGSNINVEYYQSIFTQAYTDRNIAFHNRTLHLDVSFFKPLNTFKGYLKVKVSPPPECYLSTWAPVGTRVYENSSTKLRFYNCEQIKFLNTAHIQNYLHAGWKVELINNEYNVIFTRQAKFLKDYVDLIGNEKTNARADNNEALAQIYKLLMNSLYGKMAQKPKHLIHHQEGITGSQYLTKINEKSLNTDWNSSYHYIGAYITAWANYILWQTCYNLELHRIYNGDSISLRAGIICYVDTDSIIYNKNIASDYVTFVESEDIGYFDDNLANFCVTWKEEKFGRPIKKLIVASKKFYCLIDKENNILSIKGKGVHGAQMKMITYERLKQIIGGMPLKLAFSGIIKKREDIKDQFMTNNRYTTNDDIIKRLTEGLIRKTLTRETISCEVIPTNEIVLKDNAMNLNQIQAENWTNYLKFTCSPLSFSNDRPDGYGSDESSDGGEF